MGRRDILTGCRDCAPRLPPSPGSRALDEHALVDRNDADHLTEEVDDLFGTRLSTEVSVDDDPVEAWIHSPQQH